MCLNHSLICYSVCILENNWLESQIYQFPNANGVSPLGNECAGKCWAGARRAVRVAKANRISRHIHETWRNNPNGYRQHKRQTCERNERHTEGAQNEEKIEIFCVETTKIWNENLFAIMWCESKWKTETKAKHVANEREGERERTCAHGGASRTGKGRKASMQRHSPNREYKTN